MAGDRGARPRAGEPFRTLGLPDDASADDVRGARRRLAMAHHPDRGGDPATMQALNDAADEALRRLAAPSTSSGGAADQTANRTANQSGEAPGRTGADRPRGEPTGVTTDVASFTVEALPAETFEALTIVATWLGETLDDEPPYRLDVHLGEPLSCWCRLDLLPDAGATTVGITLGAVGGVRAPDIDLVRDVWVDALNRLDWDEGGPHERR